MFNSEFKALVPETEFLALQKQHRELFPYYYIFLNYISQYHYLIQDSWTMRYSLTEFSTRRYNICSSKSCVLLPFVLQY